MKVLRNSVAHLSCHSGGEPAPDVIWGRNLLSCGLVRSAERVGRSRPGLATHVLVEQF